MEKENKEKCLMHTCCAPCSVYCIEKMENENIPFDMLWFNPNIQPVTEYRKRRDCLIEYAKMNNKKLLIEDEYDIYSFVKEAVLDIENRCKKVCYDLRLGFAAKKAKELGYNSYTTTLLVSPYQDTEALIEVGKAYGEKYGIEFLPMNFKEGFKYGQNKARELGLYMQKYCGCIFSEAERYKKNTWKIKNIDISSIKKNK